MWRSGRLFGENLREGATDSVASKRWGAIRWKVLAITLPILVIVVLIGFGWYFGKPDDGGLSGTMWKHQKANTTVTVEFGRLGHISRTPAIKYTTDVNGTTKTDSVTYVALPDETLWLNSGERVAIDSKTSEQLILSGGPWKLDKTVFERQK